MNIFGIGLPEMAVIAAIGLLVFGPKRLPELGKTLGKTLRGFQSASQEFEQEFRKAVGDVSDANPEQVVPLPALEADHPEGSPTQAIISEVVSGQGDSTVPADGGGPQSAA